MTVLDGPLDLRPAPKPRFVVPIRRWDRAAQKALKFAVAFSTDVTVVQVLTHDRKEDELTKRWAEIVERPAAEAGVVAPKLHVVSSEYRELFAPLVAFIRRIGAEDTTRPVAVVVPEIVKPRWWHALLHNNTASLLKAILLMKGGPRVVVVNAPFYVSEEALENAKTREGPAKASPFERPWLRPRVTAGT